MQHVHTYADGYGRWHAIVPDTPMGLSRAVRSIAAELFDRAPKGTTFLDLRAYVEQNIASLPSDKPGTVHFIEYSID